MRIGCHGPYLLHGDILWQQAVEFIDKAGTVDFLLSIEVGYHLCGMYTGIGASSTDNRGVLT
jgi:hypothetical protein